MNKGNIIFLFLVFSNFFFSCSKKIIPDKPFLSKTQFQPDSLPLSEVNIPVQVSLKPVYKLAEKMVDTVFTSPRWPHDWETIDCANRYKYYFRRSSLRITANNQSMNMGFTGYYKIIGSTRVCIGNAVVSPWSPPCQCGFEEGERRVKINFSNTVSVLPDYKLKLSIKRLEPEPVDKCTVCFLGVDITSLVMKGLKQELDLAKKAIEDSFGVLDLKPQMQQLWNKLTPSYNVQGLGWLQINPQKFRINNYVFRNDTLNIQLGITARPVIRLEKITDRETLIPDLDNSAASPGFNIFLDAVLNYDSLSRILNDQIAGQQFDFKKSGVKKTVIVQDCRIYGTGNERIIIKMSFGGSETGLVYFTGNPVYNEKQKTLEITGLDFDVKTKDFLLKNSAWLFNRRIAAVISERTRFDLSKYFDSAGVLINRQLNQEWMKGIESSGQISELRIRGIYPMENHLIIRSQASGLVQIKADAGQFSF
jgi:hypothetical protein